jgi:polyhydroxybutyrate depolymerase
MATWCGKAVGLASFPPRSYVDGVRVPFLSLLVALPALVACDSRAGTGSTSAPAASSTAPAPRPIARPYAIHVPSTIASAVDRSRPAPLVVALHGYGAPGGEAFAHALGLDALADEQGFVLATPDGLVDSRGARFWNASDACCDFDHTGVDDVAYVAWLIDDVAAKVAVDPDRVFVIGHSNGGFLAHRLACDRAARIAGAVSVAGAGWKDTSRCAPSEPVSILEIHGDADATVRMTGGLLFDRPRQEYPSSQETMAMWALADGCAATPRAAGAAFDFDDAVPGPDTTPATWAPCRGGVTVDLWTERKGSHLPHPTRAGLQAIAAWMAAHPKHPR